MGERIRWAAEDELYIRTRATRYPGALDVDPTWTQEALDDPDLIGSSPTPNRESRASRFIGESPSCGSLLVVIAYRDIDGTLHGVNSWPATGFDRKVYEGSDDDGEIG